MITGMGVIAMSSAPLKMAPMDIMAVTPAQAGNFVIKVVCGLKIVYC